MDVMAALVRASQAGVPVYMTVRGICCICPGVPGYTNNIHIRSVVGRYLEHSRIFIFGQGERQRIFIGSGDLLNRNTMRRVEIFAEIHDHKAREQVLKIIELLTADGIRAWEMLPDGSYRKEWTVHSDPLDTQMALAEYFAKPVEIVNSRDSLGDKMKGFLAALRFGKQ